MSAQNGMKGYVEWKRGQINSKGVLGKWKCKFACLEGNTLTLYDSEEAMERQHVCAQISIGAKTGVGFANASLEKDGGPVVKIKSSYNLEKWKIQAQDYDTTVLWYTTMCDNLERIEAQLNTHALKICPIPGSAKKVSAHRCFCIIEEGRVIEYTCKHDRDPVSATAASDLEIELVPITYYGMPHMLLLYCREERSAVIYRFPCEATLQLWVQSLQASGAILVTVDLEVPELDIDTRRQRYYLAHGYTALTSKDLVERCGASLKPPMRQLLEESAVLMQGAIAVTSAFVASKDVLSFLVHNVILCVHESTFKVQKVIQLIPSSTCMYDEYDEKYQPLGDDTFRLVIQNDSSTSEKYTITVGLKLDKPKWITSIAASIQSEKHELLGAVQVYRDICLGNAFSYATRHDLPGLFAVQKSMDPFHVRDANGRSIVHFAAYTGSLESVVCELNGFESPLLYTCDNAGLQPMHFACCANSIDSMMYLIQEASESQDILNQSDSMYHKPLWYAAFGRSWAPESAAALALLSKYVSIDQIDQGTGMTCLQFACKVDLVHVADTCIQLGADVRRYWNGITALHIATKHGSIKTLTALLEQGVSPSLGDEEGNTPLHHIARQKAATSSDIAKLLVGYGARIDQSNARGVSIEQVFHLRPELWTCLKRYAKAYAVAKDAVGSGQHPQYHHVADSESEQCMQCSTAFKLKRRRHHCRYCGILACAKCTSKVMHDSKTGKRVRICIGCYNMLKGKEVELKKRPDVYFDFDHILREQEALEGDHPTQAQSCTSSDASYKCSGTNMFLPNTIKLNLHKRSTQLESTSQKSEALSEDAADFLCLAQQLRTKQSKWL